MSELATYVPDQVFASVAGIPIEGWDEIRIEPAEDGWKSKVSTDGQVARSRSNNRMAKITVVMQQTSKTNALLTALYNLDINSPNGQGVGAFQVRDNQGASLHRADACWIVRLPNVQFGAEVGTLEWQFDVDELKFGAGGN